MNITKESIIDDLNNDRLPLPTLPEVAIKVRETVDDDNATIRDIADIINTDAALSARIIQVANSALYRGISTADNVQMAITRMGLNTVRNLATSLVMKQLFQATHPVVDKYLRNTWKLSTDIAALSAVLAKSYTTLDADSALLAGLTHSIGVSPILVKAESDPGLLNNTDALEALIYELYPRIGAEILKNWEFPDSMIRVPEQHLDTTRAHDGEVDYTDIVQVALIQTVSGTSHPLGHLDTTTVPAFHRIGMAEDFEEIDMSGGVVEVKEAIA
ncbi:MAG: HDOD domain-containing protein [Gammaproteobacteria bacterium]|nr:HDOD domain-containing protein [Gammaproteobacteria bacterium]